MPRPLKFSQRLDRYPPILVRLLAVRGRGKHAWAMTDRQIVQASGLALTMADVKHLSYSTGWADVPVGKMQAFLAACSLDLERRTVMQRAEFFRLEGVFDHLKRSPEWDYFRELVEIWADSVK